MTDWHWAILIGGLILIAWLLNEIRQKLQFIIVVLRDVENAVKRHWPGPR